MRAIRTLLFPVAGKTILTGLSALCLLYGCATAPQPMPTVTSGDAVLLDYTCRIEDGSILSTTRQADAHDENAQYSNAFVALNAYGPVAVTVDNAMQPPQKPIVHPLGDAIVSRLIPQLDGLTYGESHRLTVTSEAIADLPDMERYLQYARTMRRPKQRTIPRAQFVSNTGKEPVVGDVMFSDNPMQWRVTDVQNESVAVEYTIEDGRKIMLPYGEAVVHDRGDHYDLEIETRPGGLVRVGPYIGRIADITDRLFLVDFEHPFGGRELACEVTVKPADANLEQVMESVSADDGKKTVTQ
jgi:FKBP-type peptidyl-prolyl cis-trans isomerase 2